MGFGKKYPVVREPRPYHIFRVRRLATFDPASAETSSIKRVLINGAAGGASPDAAQASLMADPDFIGFGVRVYEGRYAFASRDEKQIEIETLGVRSCIVVTFTNLDRKIVGLLRFNGVGSDGVLLSEFIHAANRRTRAGDRTKIEVHGGGPVEGETPLATMLRRGEAVRAIDESIRNAPAPPADQGALYDRDPCVRWMDGGCLDLRIESWNGKVFIPPGNSGS